MRMPDEDITVNDLIRGEVTFPKGTVPDYVIVRGNGIPLYTLVSPVDDALQKITHTCCAARICSAQRRARSCCGAPWSSSASPTPCRSMRTCRWCLARAPAQAGSGIQPVSP